MQKGTRDFLAHFRKTGNAIRENASLFAKREEQAARRNPWNAQRLPPLTGYREREKNQVNMAAVERYSYDVPIVATSSICWFRKPTN